MQMSSADKQAFVNALDQAKRTVHPDLVICTRRCVVKKKIMIEKKNDDVVHVEQIHRIKTWNC